MQFSEDCMVGLHGGNSEKNGKEGSARVGWKEEGEYGNLVVG